MSLVPANIPCFTTTAIIHALYNTFPQPYVKLSTCHLAWHEEKGAVTSWISKYLFPAVFMIISNNMEAMCLAAVDTL